MITQTLKICTVSLLATLLVACGSEEPAKKVPGTLTEAIGVDESQANKIRFVDTPSATSTKVISNTLKFQLPIKFDTSTGVSKTILVTFAGRGDDTANSEGTVKFRTKENPAQKLERFSGVAVATIDDSIDPAITQLVEQAISFEVSCFGSLSSDPKEACFELVASMYVKDAVKNRSLRKDYEKAFHFVADYNSTYSETGLVLNLRTTRQMKAASIKGKVAAIDFLFKK